MATKKPQEIQEETPQEIQEETPQEIQEAKPEKPRDSWAEEVEMFVPRKPKGDDQSWPIFINERRYWVPANGKKQKLPKPVAEILQMAIDAENALDDYINEVNEKTRESEMRVGI